MLGGISSLPGAKGLAPWGLVPTGWPFQMEPVPSFSTMALVVVPGLARWQSDRPRRAEQARVGCVRSVGCRGSVPGG